MSPITQYKFAQVPGLVALANASNSGCPSDAKKQTFTVQGADDVFADGTQTYSVTLTMVANTDSGYSSATSPSNPTVSNADNEPSGKAIFVTSGSYNGENTAAGVKNGDDICNANKPSYAPSGTYKALLASDSGGEVLNDRKIGIDWPINSSYYYYLCTAPGNNCNDEFKHMFVGSSFDPTNMQTYTPSAIYFPPGEYWTGLNLNLTPAIQSSTPAGTCVDPATVYRHNCHGFTYENCPTAGGVSFYGETWSGGGVTTQNTNVDCTTTKKLICVQQ